MVFGSIRGSLRSSQHDEQWGLVVNEATAAGLPVLLSEHCRCSEDLVDPGVSGYRFAPTVPGDVTDRMLDIATDDCDRIAMGRAGQALIATGRRIASAANCGKRWNCRSPTKLARWIATALVWHRERTDG